jgi:hypothetical protein
MKKLMIVIVSTFLLIGSSIQSSSAESKWTPISSNDYIFGYTSLKYSCWSGVTSANLPIIEVYSQNAWVKAATGQILPTGSDIETPCGGEFPIAVGFQWQVMAPSPPTYQTNRYSALYRAKIPDIEKKYKELLFKQVTELQETCCEEKITIKKVPYIAKVKKNGKTVSVIKYKTQKISEQVTYMKEVLVDKQEYQDKIEIIPGYVGNPGNISIYPSVTAMQNEAAALARGVLCAFGFSAECKT